MALDVSRVIPNAGGDQPITCLAWNRSKNELYVGSQDTRVRVWDLDTGELRRTMALHKGWVTDLCYAPSVRLLFSSSLDSTVVVWKDPGRALQAIEHSSGPIHSLAYQADKRVLLAGGTGYVFMYRVVNNAEYRDFQPQGSATTTTHAVVENVEVIKLIMPIMECHTDIVRGIETNGLGRVFSASFDSRIVLFDLDRPRDSKRPFQNGHRCHGGAISCLDICEEENFLMTGAFDGSLKTWSFEGRNLESFYDLGEVVHCVCYVPSTHTVLISARDYRLVAIDSRSWSFITDYVYEQSRFNEFKIVKLQRADGADMVFGVTRSREVVVWKYVQNAATRVMRKHKEWIESHVVVRVPVEEDAMGMDDDGKIPIEVQRSYVERMDHAREDMIEEDRPELRNVFREYVFSGGQDGSLFKWGAGDQERVANIYRVEDEYTGHEASILCICHVPEYECVVTGGEDRMICGWPVETKVKTSDLAESATAKVQNLRLSGHTSRITGLANLGNGFLASVSHDLSLRVWDLEHGRQVAFVERAHDAQCTGLDVMRGEDRAQSVLGTCGMESVAKLWDASTLQLKYELRGHTSEVTQIKWAAYVRCWITASDDGTVGAWDLNGTRLQSFSFAGETCTAMFIDNVDQLIAMASADRVLRLYDVELGMSVASYRGHTDIIRSIGCLDECRLYVSSSWDGTVRLWHQQDLSAGQRRAALHRQLLRATGETTHTSLISRGQKREPESGTGEGLEGGEEEGDEDDELGMLAGPGEEVSLLKRLNITLDKPKSLRKDKNSAVAGVMWLYAGDDDEAQENAKRLKKLMETKPLPGRSERLSRALDYHEKRLQQTLEATDSMDAGDDNRSLMSTATANRMAGQRRKASNLASATAGGRLQKWRDVLDAKAQSLQPTATDAPMGQNQGAQPVPIHSSRQSLSLAPSSSFQERAQR